ncbi:hypothetical protein [Aurantiacibacter marinus]|uniref:Uncharacterized protein n=1 Tax=Aurantiacibacter marinus TaxID=874156 RepID=A0A0H0XNG0_9SPHN|nr:hypothetical protein [Aurantiacibacter marinus]KLI63477.1 hypothetical protein AAV99_06795 [Aurantiacibacter marinus]
MLVFGLTLSLSGCSFIYEIKAVWIEGQLAFIPTETDFWGNPDPDCFHSIDVSIRNGAPAIPAEGDNVRLVEVGYFWKQSFASLPCANPFPVIYGAAITGEELNGVTQFNVAAKPLGRGVVYEVRTGSETIGYGSDSFMIEDDGALRNMD